MSNNEALVRTLIKLMSVVTDTNMIKRGGVILADKIKGKSAELIYAELEKIEEFDTQLIKENLSPGGSADLLAVTWFIYNLEREINTKIKKLEEENKFLKEENKRLREELNKKNMETWFDEKAENIYKSQKEDILM